MVNFKKIVAILCSATMIIAAPITAFATETDPEIEAGTGNILAYSATTVTVPTEIKVSFNPQKWDFYLDGTNKVNSQIVSLNYGVSSMATMDRKITVEFTASATGTPATGKKAVEFVDSADKVAAKTEDNPDGAEHDELKIYLAVAGGTEKVTASRGATPTTFAITNGTSNVTADLLADVTMTAEDGGAQAFVTGDTATTSKIAFKLGKGAYELKTGEKPDFDTTQTAFADMVQPKTLGDIVGFTFTGAMNEDADWTKADLTAIAITPEYTIEEADGEEVDVEDGGYNQIATTPSSYVSTSTISGTNNVVTLSSLPEGVTVSKVQCKAADGEAYADLPAARYTVANGQITFVSATVTAFTGGTFKIVYSDNHEDVLNIE